MVNYELTNSQRKYFGLEEIDAHWDKVELKGDKYRPDSMLYFEGCTIRKHVISTENKYLETQYHELTKDREILLPKTERGKEIKLTAATLEQKSQVGVYLYVDGFGAILIGNYTSQTTFYSSHWEKEQEKISKPIPQAIDEFITDSPQNHLSEISIFKTLTRKHFSAKPGDYFCFKLNRKEYGVGRVLLDVRKLKKQGLIHSKHGLGFIMTRPLVVQLFSYISDSKSIDISTLENTPTLPPDLMMDNLLFYGEYEIIGHKKLLDSEFDFPISYGKVLDRREMIFLQWGLIHKELPISKFNKYLEGETALRTNPFGVLWGWI